MGFFKVFWNFSFDFRLSLEFMKFGFGFLVWDFLKENAVARDVKQFFKAFWNFSFDFRFSLEFVVF